MPHSACFIIIHFRLQRDVGCLCIVDDTSGKYAAGETMTGIQEFESNNFERRNVLRHKCHNIACFWV
jgi:hypothetical protein